MTSRSTDERKRKDFLEDSFHKTFQPVQLSIPDARAGTTPISPCPEDARGYLFVADPVAPATSEASIPDVSKAPVSRNALSSAASKFHSAAVMRSLSKRDQMLMRICAQPDSALWTNALPTFAHSSLDNSGGRIAFLLWLGARIPLLEGVKSVPNGDQTGRTILSANGGPRSYSHDGLRNVLTDLEREAGNAAWTEPAGCFNRWASLAAAAVAAAAAAGAETADQRRGDVLSVNPRTAERGTRRRPH